MHQKRLEEKYQNINNSNYFRIERLWAITLFLKLFYELQLYQNKCKIKCQLLNEFKQNEQVNQDKQKENEREKRYFCLMVHLCPLKLKLSILG